MNTNNKFSIKHSLHSLLFRSKKKHSLKHWASVLSVGLCCASSFDVWCQNGEESEKTWYRVELVIFEQRPGYRLPDDEEWPKNVVLAYPPNIQYFNVAESEQDQSLEERQGANSSTASNSVAASDNNAEPTTPKPFMFLSSEQKQLVDVARRVERKRNKRVLFHETWLQPMEKRGDSPSLLILGGEKFGNHQELEGSIHISLSRYLHLNTNLWLSQFEANYGQEDKHWPSLPEVPTPFTALGVNQKFNFKAGDVKAKAPWDLNIEKNTAANEGFGIKIGQDEKIKLGNYDQFSKQPFLIKQIVTLKQRRRMRSGELHYVDHPLMGLFIRIDSYEFSPGEQE